MRAQRPGVWEGVGMSGRWGTEGCETANRNRVADIDEGFGAGRRGVGQSASRRSRTRTAICARRMPHEDRVARLATRSQDVRACSACVGAECRTRRVTSQSAGKSSRNAISVSRFLMQYSCILQLSLDYLLDHPPHPRGFR